MPEIAAASPESLLAKIYSAEMNPSPAANDLWLPALMSMEEYIMSKSISLPYTVEEKVVYINT